MYATYNQKTSIVPPRTVLSGKVRQIDGTHDPEKTYQVHRMTNPGSSTRFVKRRLSGGNDLFNKWTDTFFPFETASFITACVPFTSTAIALL